MFEGRVAIGYDHGYDAHKFYLGLALDPSYVEGFVQGSLDNVSASPQDQAGVVVTRVDFLLPRGCDRCSKIRSIGDTIFR